MLATKAVGRNAAAMKYDILSALGVAALAGDKHRQKLTLRLMVLITSRYNWQAGELSIGRAEIARLWSVDERTVKRELAKFRTLGWLLVKRAGARGRVTVYEIDLAQVLADTRGVWPTIGSDFAARMEGPEAVPAPADPKVVPFQRAAPVAATVTATEGQGGLWPQVLQALEARDPALAAAWFRPLQEMERQGGCVRLAAPTRFVAEYITTHLTPRLVAAYGRFDPAVRRVLVEAV